MVRGEEEECRRECHGWLCDVLSLDTGEDDVVNQDRRRRNLSGKDNSFVLDILNLQCQCRKPKKSSYGL